MSEAREIFEMVANPKGREASAILLSQDIWKVEDSLDLIYSSVKNAYSTYTEPGESETLLKTDGTLIFSYPTMEECKEKFEIMKKKLSKTEVIPTIKYDKLELEKYKIFKKMQGSLEDVTPKGLVDFLRNGEKETQYDPKKISYEFVDPETQKNFIRITFDKVTETKKLLLDVTVESNKVEYAKKTIKEIEALLQE